MQWDMYKTCSKCGETKHLSEFCFSSATRDGHQTYCKSCAKQIIKKDYGKIPNHRPSQYNLLPYMFPNKDNCNELYVTRRETPFKGYYPGEIIKIVVSRENRNVPVIISPFLVPYNNWDYFCAEWKIINKHLYEREQKEAKKEMEIRQKKIKVKKPRINI